MSDFKSPLFVSQNGRAVYDRVVESVSRYGMDKLLSGGVLIGLSGGADSVFLLHFLCEYLGKDKILCVHINHMIRGDEADSDEEFSRSLCKEMDVEFLSFKIDVPKLSASTDCGIEECARNIRYSKFKEIIEGRRDISSVAVAHNSTDNAETVILNMLRGAGTRGASGIPPVRDNICRPLIGISKDEIVELLELAKVKFVTDSTNLSTEYRRNYVRLEILPSLKRLSPDPDAMIGRLSENLRSDDDFITGEAERFLRENKPTASALRQLHNAVFIRVLALMAGRLGSISSSCAKDIRALLPSDNFSYSLGGDMRFVCELGLCRVVRGNSTDIEYSISLNGEITHIPEINSVVIERITSIDNSSLNVYKKSIQANLRSAIISGELVVRSKRDGDTVYYGGMTHKLKKLFNDRKIPPSLRSRIPVVCDDRGVVWVPGFGVRDDSPSDPHDHYIAICSQTDEPHDSFITGRDFK